MDYTFVTSLEHRTLIKIAATLWSVDHIRNFISRFYFPLILSRRRTEWQKLENRVVEKGSELPLAKPLKHKLLCFIRAVGLQIIAWLDFQYYCCSFITKLPSEFFWTSKGTIDKQKTAEVLVNDESLHILKRYRMACTYCLEDHILVLWNQLVNYPYNINLTYIRLHEQPLVSFWSHYLEGEIHQIADIMRAYCDDDYVTPYEYAFRRFALSGNEAATRYFLKKLTPEEKEKILVRTAVLVAYRHFNYVHWNTNFPIEYCTDIVYFLLTHMNEEQQIEVFENDLYTVLQCFLEWPWQSFFMKTAERMCNFLTKFEYYYLLSSINERALIEEHDCTYRELFKEFWQQSPSAYKKFIIKLFLSKLLFDLFQAGDEDNIKLIFKYAVAEEREKFIFYGEGKKICRDLIYDRKLGLLKFFVREILSSKDIIIKFKEEFIIFFTECCSKEKLEKEKYILNKFLQLLDDFIDKDDEKRNVGKGDSSPVRVQFNK